MFLAGLGLVGALLGAAAAKAEGLDPVGTTRRRIAFGIAALAACAGSLWIGVMAATASI